MKSNTLVFVIDRDKDEALFFQDVIEQYDLPFTVQHFFSLYAIKEYLKTAPRPDGIILDIRGTSRTYGLSG